MRLLTAALVLVFFFTSLLSHVHTVQADELDDLNKQISELQKKLEDSKKATEPLESELNSLTAQLNGIVAQVNQIERDIAEKRKQLDENYAKLDEKKGLFDKTVREYYMKNTLFTPLFMLASGSKAKDVTQVLALHQREAKEDKSLITSLALTLVSIEEQKAKLEEEEKKLAVIKASLSKEQADLAVVVKGAKDYQSQVSGQIAELSQKQNEILAARSGGFTATIGDSDAADDYNASIKGFRESAPGGYFAAFSFGAHTHRKGMSQYGAYGRANAGQDFRAILKAYYQKDPVQKDTGGDINVAGFGSMNFEERYLLGIAEMPSSWPKEALKAQAVAARTYAYRYKAEGREICTTEACQVFNSGKADNPPQAWRDAVNETRGIVLEDVVTYYSSTTGGWVSPMGWDTTDGQGGGNFSDRAYEKLSGSPWFYKAWYTKGYSTSSDKCGRANPWLSPQEMADMVNAYFVLYGGGSGADSGRVTPVTTSCWGGNPYSMDELRSVSEGYGGGVGSVSGVNVVQGGGTTNEVVFQTDKGEKRVNGGNFKTAFNLRAPGYLSIPQSGFAFYNIERK